MPIMTCSSLRWRRVPCAAEVKFTHGKLCESVWPFDASLFPALCLSKQIFVLLFYIFLQFQVNARINGKIGNYLFHNSCPLLNFHNFDFCFWILIGKKKSKVPDKSWIRYPRPQQKRRQNPILSALLSSQLTICLRCTVLRVATPLALGHGRPFAHTQPTAYPSRAYPGHASQRILMYTQRASLRFHEGLEPTTINKTSSWALP